MTDQLASLFRLEQFGIKFGLDNIRTLVACLGNPERAFRSIHIAGTNGKGSVTAMVDAALRAAGRHVGRYTSPHLTRLAERFVIDGSPVGDAELEESAARVRAAIDGLRASGALKAEPTFFEATTAMAFDLFQRAAVELAVVEVGLGGRLDSTNVISPVITAITSIDFDHQQYLGSTLGEIAFEKAGIIKGGVPVIVDELRPEALRVVLDVARERGSHVIHAREGVHLVTAEDGDTARIRLRTPVHDYGEIHLALRGAHQQRNAILAVRILETLAGLGESVPPSAVVHGLEHVSWPGRLDWRRFADGREIIMDAAHNPAGATALAEYLAGLGGAKPPLVFAAMRDKDLEGMLRALAPVVSRIIVTRASNARSADPDVLESTVRRVSPDLPVEVASSPEEAMIAAWSTAPRIVVAGSIFLLGDVMRQIGAW